MRIISNGRPSRKFRRLLLALTLFVTFIMPLGAEEGNTGVSLRLATPLNRPIPLPTISILPTLKVNDFRIYAELGLGAGFPLLAFIPNSPNSLAAYAGMGFDYRISERWRFGLATGVRYWGATNPYTPSELGVPGAQAQYAGFSTFYETRLQATPYISFNFTESTALELGYAISAYMFQDSMSSRLDNAVATDQTAKDQLNSRHDGFKSDIDAQRSFNNLFISVRFSR